VQRLQRCKGETTGLVGPVGGALSRGASSRTLLCELLIRPPAAQNAECSGGGRWCLARIASHSTLVIYTWGGSPAERQPVRSTGGRTLSRQNCTRNSSLLHACTALVGSKRLLRSHLCLSRASHGEPYSSPSSSSSSSGSRSGGSGGGSSSRCSAGVVVAM
jgi:hypothetical protein